MSLSNPTREEEKWMDRITRMGCVVCRSRGARAGGGLRNEPSDRALALEKISLRDAQDVEDVVRSAIAAEQPLEIIGHGTKRAIGQPMATNAVLDISALNAIVAYDALHTRHIIEVRDQFADDVAQVLKAARQVVGVVEMGNVGHALTALEGNA